MTRFDGAASFALIVIHKSQRASGAGTISAVGAGRAAFRLSAKRPVHPTHMRWLKYCIRGQVRSHGFAARQRYVEEVVGPPAVLCRA